MSSAGNVIFVSQGHLWFFPNKILGLVVLQNMLFVCFTLKEAPVREWVGSSLRLKYLAAWDSDRRAATAPNAAGLTCYSEV